MRSSPSYGTMLRACRKRSARLLKVSVNSLALGTLEVQGILVGQGSVSRRPS
jgi:hypothetical protein